MKMVAFLRTACVQIVALTILLSSCDEGSSVEDSLAADDCTPSINLLTNLTTQVDPLGNITTTPVATNTLSGCETSTGSDGTIELTESITNRFISSEDFDVWECVTENGANFRYALLDRNNSSLKRYGLEIGPVAAVYPDSQTLLWKASNADTLLLSVPEQGVEIEWTSIRFPSVDAMSANSTTRGTLQCNRTTGDDNGGGLYGFDVILSSLAAGSDGTVELTSRVNTRYESDLDLDIWECSDSEFRFAYTFFNRDYPNAPSNESFGYFGLELGPGNEYFWHATSADSLLLEYREQGTQIEWTNIRFPKVDTLTAYSASKGTLQCTLQPLVPPNR